MICTGIGYDAHRLAEGRALILGGVRIPHSKGLEGHSDADALAHAICDAIFGALGEGDIGTFFPDTDPRWQGQSSLFFLREAARLAKARGGRVEQVDSTIIAERPKLAPFIPAMRAKLSEALGLPPGRVGVKATTNEGMGFLGRGEGIAALATACVTLPDS